MEAGFACGSMVLFFLFTQIFAHCAKICVNKDVFFRPAGGGAGRLSRQTPGLEPTA